jgi:hypothetical protein
MESMGGHLGPGEEKQSRILVRELFERLGGRLKASFGVKFGPADSSGDWGGGSAGARLRRSHLGRHRAKFDVGPRSYNQARGGRKSRNRLCCRRSEYQFLFLFPRTRTHKLSLSANWPLRGQASKLVFFAEMFRGRVVGIPTPYAKHKNVKHQQQPSIQYHL